MEEFQIELAGVPVRIRCRYPGNREFFRGYFTEKEPLFTAEPSEGDLARMQSDFDRMDREEGRPERRRDKSFLENNALHGLLAERLPEHGVLLMHGSALCMEGEGYLFTAPSGTGKSTHARLWREAFGDRVYMVNDDKPLLKITDGGVTVWGTPWDGKHHLSRNTGVPLKAIAVLERSGDNRIHPLKMTDAFPVLMKQCFSSKDPAPMTRILELEKKLLSAVGFYKLCCNMEPEAARTAYEGMNARQQPED